MISEQRLSRRDFRYATVRVRTYRESIKKNWLLNSGSLLVTSVRFAFNRNLSETFRSRTPNANAFPWTNWRKQNRSRYFFFLSHFSRSNPRGRTSRARLFYILLALSALSADSFVGYDARARYWPWKNGRYENIQPRTDSFSWCPNP